MVGDGLAGATGGTATRHTPTAPSGPGLAPTGLALGQGESTAEDELTFLRDEAESLKHYLEGIECRIGELQKKAE